MLLLVSATPSFAQANSSGKPASKEVKTSSTNPKEKTGASEKTLRVGTAHFPPFRIVDSGKVSGADAEVIEQVFKRMGYKVEFEIAPFKRVYTMGAEGALAAVFTMTKNPDRERDFLFSSPISSVTDVLFKNDDNKLEWKSFRDLKGLTIGMSLGYSYPEPFLNALDANLFTPDVVASAEPEIVHLRKLQQKRIDLAICEISVCSWIISTKKDLAHIVPMRKKVASSRTFHLGFSRKWPGAESLLRRFNRELAKFIAEGKRQKIFQKYHIKN